MSRQAMRAEEIAGCLFLAIVPVAGAFVPAGLALALWWLL